MKKEFIDKMDLADVWEEIHDAFLLGKAGLQNELEIYRKWIPVFNEKLNRHLTRHSSGRAEACGCDGYYRLFGIHRPGCVCDGYVDGEKTPACDHKGSYETTAGWVCPKCGSRR